MKTTKVIKKFSITTKDIYFLIQHKTEVPTSMEPMEVIMIIKTRNDVILYNNSKRGIVSKQECSIGSVRWSLPYNVHNGKTQELQYLLNFAIHEMKSKILSSELNIVLINMCNKNSSKTEMYIFNKNPLQYCINKYNLLEKQPRIKNTDWMKYFQNACLDVVETETCIYHLFSWKINYCSIEDIILLSIFHSSSLLFFTQLNHNLNESYLELCKSVNTGFCFTYISSQFQDTLSKLLSNNNNVILSINYIVDEPFTDVNAFASKRLCDILCSSGVC